MRFKYEKKIRLHYYHNLIMAGGSDENWKINKWYPPENIIKQNINFISKNCHNKLCTKNNIEIVLREYYLSMPKFINIKVFPDRFETFESHVEHIVLKTNFSKKFVMEVIYLELKTSQQISSYEEINFIKKKCIKCTKNEIKKVLSYYYNEFVPSKKLNLDVHQISKKIGVSRKIIKKILEYQLQFYQKKKLIRKY